LTTATTTIANDRERWAANQRTEAASGWHDAKSQWIQGFIRSDWTWDGCGVSGRGNCSN